MGRFVAPLTANRCQFWCQSFCGSLPSLAATCRRLDKVRKYSALRAAAFWCSNPLGALEGRCPSYLELALAARVLTRNSTRDYDGHGHVRGGCPFGARRQVDAGNQAERFIDASSVCAIREARTSCASACRDVVVVETNFYSRRKRQGMSGD